MSQEGTQQTTTERLYSILEARLQAQGEDLPCTREALRVYSESPRADLDYLKLINLDNRSFFDACYMIAFNTYPPAHYVEQWQSDMEQLSREAFQKKFINAFIRLPDIRKWNVRIRNCPYLTPPAKLRTGLRTRVYRTFLPVYKRLPASAKRRIKQVLWKFFFQDPKGR